MPHSAHYTPLTVGESIPVVDAVLALDPLGADNCPYCAYPERRQLDIDLLTSETMGPVLEKHQLAVRSQGDGWEKDNEFGKACRAVERHRRLHVLKVFDSLQDIDAGIPDPTSPTIRFVDWTVKQYIEVYKSCDESKDALASLAGIARTLQLRAGIRGEINTKKTSPNDIETEVVLSDATKRKMLEMEAKRLGLKLIDPRAALEITKAT